MPRRFHPVPCSPASCRAPSMGLLAMGTPSSSELLPDRAPGHHGNGSMPSPALVRPPGHVSGLQRFLLPGHSRSELRHIMMAVVRRRDSSQTASSTSASNGVAGIPLICWLRGGGGGGVAHHVADRGVEATVTRGSPQAAGACAQLICPCVARSISGSPPSDPSAVSFWRWGAPPREILPLAPLSPDPASSHTFIHRRQ